MHDRITLNTLGTPELVSADFRNVTPRTRRALAIIAYLSRMPGFSDTRESIANLFWPGVEKTKASNTLRQTLLHIREMQEEVGFTFIGTDNQSISLDASRIITDQDKIRECLKGGLMPANNKATRLWRGDFLEGYEDMGEAFSEWLADEREAVYDDLEQAATEVIIKEGNSHGDDHIEAVASFLLWMDPSDEFAHSTLIRLYIRQGNRDKAENQYRNCKREMANSLGREPSKETQKLLKEAASSPTGNLLPKDKQAIRFPSILISDSSNSFDIDARAHSVREGIVSGLSSFRTLELHESAALDATAANRPTLVSHEQGSYALRFRYDPIMQSMNVRLEDKSDGLIIFTEFVDLADDIDPQRIAHAIRIMSNRIHDGTIREATAKHPNSPFAHWHKAYELLLKFRNDTDIEALRILDELQAAYPDFGYSYAAKSSIWLKRRMSYPDLDGEQPNIADIQELLRKSINLDPWIPDTLRVLSWSHIAQEKWDDAIHGFRQALEVSPMDPFNAISVAKGLAVAGDVTSALKLADKALKGSVSTPGVFYEYLGNIHFAAGNYERAVHYLKQSPEDSFNGLVSLLAAQKAGSMNDQLPETQRLLKQASSSNFGKNLQGKSEEVLEWFQNRHGFANPDANKAFKNVLPTVAKIVAHA